MNRTSISRRVALLATAMIALPLLAGCPPPPPQSSSTTTGGDSGAKTSTSGGDTLTIKGSQTLLPLSQKWVEAFDKANPGSKITVSGGGSGQGITALINNNTDIANASRKMKDEEMKQAEAKGLKIQEVPVAKDGITIIVNASNPIKSLTLQQLADIYTGKIKDWKELGGTPGKIVANGRDSSSGTYEFFKEDVLKKADYRTDMISSNANPAIGTNVSQNAGAIGYLGVAFASEFTKTGKVKEVPISFKQGDPPVLPTVDNVHSGKYPISRSLYNYISGEPQGTAKAYLDFVTGEEGQKIVADEGYITLK